MIQTPIPTDTIRVDLPIPTMVEQWRDLYLHTAVEKIVVFFAFAVLFYLLARVVHGVIGRNIEDVNRRHVLRKWATKAFVILLILVSIALFADWLTGLGTVLALLVAGVAVALQDVLKSIVGWLYISSRSGIEIGTRIEVDGIVGDVVDIGVLKTAMLEVGGDLVFGRQSTGRLVTVPNYRVISDAVLLVPAGSPFVWQEIKVPVTFESDWRRAEEILREVGAEIHAEVAPQLAEGFRHLERRYAFKYGALTPIVYVSLFPSGVDLTLRFLVHVRRRRGAIDLASRRVLSAFAESSDIRFAYTAYRIFRDDGRAGSRPLPVDDPGGVGVGPEEGFLESR